MKKQFPATQKGKSPRKGLSAEDGRLWHQVTKTITPLSSQKMHFLKEEMNRLMDAAAVSDSPPSKPPKTLNFRAAPPTPPPPGRKGSNIPSSHPIEEKTIKNLGKGRQRIDARIDLHGMTQDRALFALLDFLQMAQHAEYKIVLVITGKGDLGRGVLRANVPRWLSLPAFSQLVNGYRESQTTHGGEGALYVRIRRRRSRDQS